VISVLCTMHHPGTVGPCCTVHTCAAALLGMLFYLDTMFDSCSWHIGGRDSDVATVADKPTARHSLRWATCQAKLPRTLPTMDTANMLLSDVCLLGSPGNPPAGWMCWSPLWGTCWNCLDGLDSWTHGSSRKQVRAGRVLWRADHDGRTAQSLSSLCQGLVFSASRPMAHTFFPIEKQYGRVSLKQSLPSQQTMTLTMVR
jgi:hypothetical protein